MYLGEPAILGVLARPRSSGLMWSGDDKLCTGDVETPFLVEKLLSGTRDQGDRGLGVLRRDVIAEKQYSL